MRPIALLSLVVSIAGMNAAAGALPCGPAAASAESTGDRATIEARIGVTRLSAATWRIEYQFSRPVIGIDYGQPVDGYRANSWMVVTPGLTLSHHEGAERLLSDGEPFNRATLEVRLYSAFPPDNYVPAARFSDGGVALFLGFLGGDALTEDGAVELNERYAARGREGEVVLVPAAAGRGEQVFAYFGPRRPIDAGITRLILDPAAPEWLVDLFRRTISEVSPVYETRLQRRLDEAPLVLIAAGEIDSIDGYSTKGGAINGQIMMTLRGRALADETEELRRMMARLMAHELAHLWQKGDAEKRFNDRQPWIHEGGAEALAVEALAASGRWSAAQAEADMRRAEQRCADERGGKSLETAIDGGRWGAVYPCGQAIFAAHRRDLFDIWAAMIRLAASRDTVYSQQLLDEVLADRGSRSHGN